LNAIVTRHDGPAESVAVPAPDPARSALSWRLELLVVGAIGLVGLLLRLRFLGVPLRYDEAFTYQTYAVLPDPRVIALSYTFPNNHILNSLAIHYAIPIFGDGKWALRCPAFLTGVGSVFAAWWAGREVSGPVAAWWAAGLVAVSSPLVDFSGNGRGYELGVFFVLVSVALAARLLRGPGPWAVRGLIATSVLGVWSVPTTAYGLVPLAVWMVGCVIFQAQPNRRARLRQAGRVAGVFILAAGLSELLLAPLTIQPGWNFVGSLPHTWPAIRGVAQAIGGSGGAAPHTLPSGSSRWPRWLRCRCTAGSPDPGWRSRWAPLWLSASPRSCSSRASWDRTRARGPPCCPSSWSSPPWAWPPCRTCSRPSPPARPPRSVGCRPGPGCCWSSPCSGCAPPRPARPAPKRPPRATTISGRGCASTSPAASCSSSTARSGRTSTSSWPSSTTTRLR